MSFDGISILTEGVADGECLARSPSRVVDATFPPGVAPNYMIRRKGGRNC